MKLPLLMLSFLAGVLVGAGALGGYWLWQHRTTEVWVTKHAMKSASGILVPKGTQLVLERWMPEGFAALKLGINVEGEALDQFDRRVEQKRFLRLPYFIDANEN